MTNFKTFVLGNLRDKKINYVKDNANKNLYIKCVFKNHKKITGKEDINPSLSISLIEKKPVFHCWSCNEKGTINKLFEYLDLPLWKLNKSSTNIKYETEEHLQVLKDKLNSEDSYKKPDGYEEWENNRVWRKLPGIFLKKLGANRWYDEKEELYRILFFIKNGKNKKNVGYIAGKTNLPTKIKWKNSYGKWIKSYGLFPKEFVFRKKQKTVCLVEGPYDALRLNYYDIPTLAFLGTYNWSKIKESTLISNCVENIVLCLDGDNAGYSAARKLKEKLEKRFNVTIVDLPEGDDPGTIHKKYIDKIFKLVINLNKNKKIKELSFLVGENIA